MHELVKSWELHEDDSQEMKDAKGVLRHIDGQLQGEPQNTWSMPERPQKEVFWEKNCRQYWRQLWNQGVDKTPYLMDVESISIQLAQEVDLDL